MAPTQLGSNYRVGYLNASSPNCSTIEKFTNQALQSLGASFRKPSRTNEGLTLLEAAMAELVTKKQIPVLCIDEFEGLGDSKMFNLEFFTGLRALAQTGLVLVVASKNPLVYIVSDHLIKASPFFNIFEQITLKPFTLTEAETFVQTKSAQAGFNEREKEAFLQYGRIGEKEWSPLRLQLVGKMLQEDKHFAGGKEMGYLSPDSHLYWQDFEKRLDEVYVGSV